MTSNAPAAPASKPEGRVDEMRGEANQAIATDKSQLTARAQQMQGEANQAIATDESKLAQKDQEIVSELQQLANLPPEQTLVLGQKVLQNVQAQAGAVGPGKGVGYVFVQSAYASAGITSLRGQGFVLAHVNGKWSAPAYISVTKLSAGMSIGAPQATTGTKRSHKPGGEVVDALIVLHRQEDLAEFFKPEFVIKGFVMAGLPGAPADSGASIVFSAATGLTLKKDGHDLNGAKVKAHAASNEKAYGKDATPEKILSGAVPVPPGLEPLHQALEALSAPQAALHAAT